MGACGSKGEKKSKNEPVKKPLAQPVSTPQNNNNKTGGNNGKSPEEPIRTEPAVARSNKVEEYYDISEEIGRGAFSVVRKARHKRTGLYFAIKFIEKKYVDKQDLLLLGREIEIMKKLEHNNVLKLEEVYETDDVIALVMELVNGGELFYKIVEKGNYSEKDAAKIVKQMLKGVEYLHTQGIAHRDLKPENLLCATDDREEFKPFRVVIADFGLSKAFDGGEEMATSCGTPDYVAPEVITAEGAYDESVDMWSCGVITYVLLCGFSPFLSSNQTGLFEKIMKVDYDFPDPEWTHISDSAKEFISGLLVKDRRQRRDAKQCLDHPWITGESAADSSLVAISDKMNKYNEQRKATKKTL